MPVQDRPPLGIPNGKVNNTLIWPSHLFSSQIQSCTLLW